VLRKIAGALADGVMPKTQPWLHKQVQAHIGKLLNRPEGGISYMDHFQRTDKTPALIAASVTRLLGDDLAKFFQPEREGDLKLSVHYRGGPRPGMSVGVYLVEGDHIYDAVFEFVDLDFVPEPIPLNLTPVPPPPPRPAPRPTPQRPAGRPNR
jgi:hypothetical protein